MRLTSILPFLFTLGWMIYGASAARAQLMSGSYVDLGKGLTGWTIGADWFGPPSPGYIDLHAQAANIIQQAVPGVGVNVDEVSAAESFDGVSGYDKKFDSWWFGGPDYGPFMVDVPPHHGVDPATSTSATEYRASYGSSPFAHFNGNTNLLYLVTDSIDGTVDMTGVLARNGFDFPIDATFSKLGTHLTTGGESVYVRMGTTGQVTVSVRNTGAGGTLSGSFGAISTGEFSGPGASFGPLAFGETATATYSFTPQSTVLPLSFVAVDVTSNVGNATQKIAGRGVSPRYDDDVPDEGLLLGDSSPGDPAQSQFTISNPVTAPGDGSLTALTITDIRFVGDSGLFDWSTDLLPGTVIPGGQSLVVNVQALMTGGLGSDEVTMILETDQGAALGGDGQNFSIPLSAVAVPEPGSILLAALGLIGLLVVRRGWRVT